MCIYIYIYIYIVIKVFLKVAVAKFYFCHSKNPSNITKYIFNCIFIYY